MIPFFDFSNEYSELEQKYLSAFKQTMEKSHFILGEQVDLFESNFAKYCGTKYAIGVGNGLDALTLILRAMDIEKIDSYSACSYVHRNMASC